MKIGKTIEGYKYEPEIKNWVKWEDISSGWGDTDLKGLSNSFCNGITINNIIVQEKTTSRGGNSLKIINREVYEIV